MSAKGNIPVSLSRESDGECEEKYPHADEDEEEEEDLELCKEKGDEECSDDWWKCERPKYTL